MTRIVDDGLLVQECVLTHPHLYEVSWASLHVVLYVLSSGILVVLTGGEKTSPQYEDVHDR